MSTDRHGKSVAALSAADARAGDWVEVEPPGGGPVERGQILEVLGPPSHRRFRVRWDEQRITIHYPAAHERIVPRAIALQADDGAPQ